MERVKITDDYGLERDVSSKAVINNNVSAYRARVKQIENRTSQYNEIAELKAEMAEIKNLLKQIVGKK